MSDRWTELSLKSNVFSNIYENTEFSATTWILRDYLRPSPRFIYPQHPHYAKHRGIVE